MAVGYELPHDPNPKTNEIDMSTDDENQQLLMKIVSIYKVINILNSNSLERE